MPDPASASKPQAAASFDEGGESAESSAAGAAQIVSSPRARMADGSAETGCPPTERAPGGNAGEMAGAAQIVSSPRACMADGSAEPPTEGAPGGNGGEMASTLERTRQPATALTEGSAGCASVRSRPPTAPLRSSSTASSSTPQQAELGAARLPTCGPSTSAGGGQRSPSPLAGHGPRSRGQRSNSTHSRPGTGRVSTAGTVSAHGVNGGAALQASASCSPLAGDAKASGSGGNTVARHAPAGDNPFRRKWNPRLAAQHRKDKEEAAEQHDRDQEQLRQARQRLGAAAAAAANPESPDGAHFEHPMAEQRRHPADRGVRCPTPPGEPSRARTPSPLTVQPRGRMAEIRAHAERRVYGASCPAGERCAPVHEALPGAYGHEEPAGDVAEDYEAARDHNPSYEAIDDNEALSRRPDWCRDVAPVVEPERRQMSAIRAIAERRSQGRLSARPSEGGNVGATTPVRSVPGGSYRPNHVYSSRANAGDGLSEKLGLQFAQPPCAR
eukprot:NODE_5219_length_1796_cov_5.630318.p1 GENE.NODE_5219_length_1796_cov_5.630318~~NODE_5219_length_1796_cov_5.630318.p1  ORF type:complete len:500 (-),score=91.25 NODE_5219_length_1796_cov_5.630318:84-1583(-)